MSSRPDGPDSLMVAALAEEARIASEFRAAWSRGETPSISRHVRGDGPGRLELLLELAAVDLACRLERGHAACVEMYLRRWPELAEDKEVLVELIRREWQARSDENAGVVRFELRERFPEVDTQLAQLPPPAPRPSVQAGGEGLDGQEAGKGGKRPNLPGYDILGELGEGAMGMVYKARQVAAGRVVALKMIHPGRYVGAERLARFRREAEATARLWHPNIVQIYDVDEHNGQPYFSLEYCEGGTLGEALAGQPLPDAAAAKLVESVAGAVGAAHAAGIIHRDLKPGNILLAADGTPKVADFGLARQVESEDGALTATGQLLGTPQYMAPEQASGDKDVGPACDIWALGAILYECCTGRPPFLAASVADVILQVKHRDPVSPRQLNASLPRDLDTIILKCLQKEPDRRYATAADLAEDLRRWQANEPIRARPVGRLERGAKWTRRNPAAAGLLAALAAAAVVTVGMLYSLARARQAQQAALEASTRSRWLSEIMIGRVEDPLLLDAGAYSLPEEIGKKTTFEEVLRRAVQKTNQQLAEQPAQQAALLAVIGSGYRSMGMYEQAQGHLERALKLWRQQGPARKLDEADTLHLLGLVHHERGRYEKDDYGQAKRYYYEALELYDRSGWGLAIETRLTLASLHQGEEDYASAKQIYQQVKEHYETRKLKRDRNYYRTEMGLIAEKVESASVGKDFTPLVVSEMLGPIEELVRLEPDQTWKRVVELFKAGSMRLIGVNDGVMAPADEQEARRAAEATFRECADLIRREYGGEHNYRAVPLLALATSMAERGDLAAAAKTGLEAVQAFRDTIGLAHEKAPYLASRAAYYLYRRDGNPVQGLKLLDEVMAALEKRSGKTHHLYANGLMFRAWFFKETGDVSAMRRCCEQARAIYDQVPLRSRYRLYPLCVQFLSEAK